MTFICVECGLLVADCHTGQHAYHEHGGRARYEAAGGR